MTPTAAPSNTAVRDMDTVKHLIDHEISEDGSVASQGRILDITNRVRAETSQVVLGEMDRILAALGEQKQALMEEIVELRQQHWSRA